MTEHSHDNKCHSCQDEGLIAEPVVISESNELGIGQQLRPASTGSRMTKNNSNASRCGN